MAPSHYYDMSEFKSFLKNENGLNILSLNCCSLRAKYDDLSIFIQEIESCNLHIDVLCLQETWLDSGEVYDYLNIDGFTFINQGRRISTHGGLGIYIKKHLEFKHLNVAQQSDIFESQFIEIKAHGSKKKCIILGNIYRPPRNTTENYSQFLNDFQVYLQELGTKSHPVTVIGDFNIDLLQISSKPLFMDIFQMVVGSSFNPRITFPSRFNLNGNSCTLIDNIFVNMCEQSLKAKAGILIHKISDHLLTFININLQSVQKLPKHIFVTKSSQQNYANLSSELQQENLENILNLDINSDPDTNYELLNNYLSNLYKKHFPVSKKRFNKKKHYASPWMNQQILADINMKNPTYKELLSTDPALPLHNVLKNRLDRCCKGIRSSIRLAK